jgi:hypothetical protein
MRFGVHSKAVAELEDVKTNLISVRRIIFTPNTDVKEARKMQVKLTDNRKRSLGKRNMKMDEIQR